ncbi:type II-A CRISPR-associated protein Csn2 [Leuconostocaceae bacterium ESL0958]|nr:type II-A CRISPR-associated protein Csn2 [Leuconostocaceae bacterium ESL0958]
MSKGKIVLESIGTMPLTDGLQLVKVAQPTIYQKLIQAIRDDAAEKIVYSEGMTPKPFRKSCLWLGDPLSGLDIRQYYNKNVYQLLAKGMSEEGMRQLYQLNQSMQGILDKELIDQNLPFQLEHSWELVKLLHGQTITLESSNSRTIFAKIEEVIHLCAMLQEQRCLVFTNLSLYYTLSDLNQLHDCLLAEGIRLLSIDFVQEDNFHADNTFSHFYIDQDFVLYS